MITNVKRNTTVSYVRNLIRYTIAPKKAQHSEHYAHGARTLALNTEYLNLGIDDDRNIIANDLTAQIIEWNKEKRAAIGKRDPKYTAITGVIAFDPEDTKRFMSVDEDGKEYLDTDKVIQIAKEAMQDVLGEDRPMYLALHGDKEHLHVHFVAAIVDSNGKIFNAEITNDQGKKESVRDFRLWEEANEKLEIKYDLTRVMHRKAMQHEGEHREPKLKRLTNGAVHVLVDKGESTPKAKLTALLENAYKHSNKQFDIFMENLAFNEITVLPNINSKGVNGLAFTLDGKTKFSGSDIGPKYKWAKLSKDLNYDNTRDYERLVALKTSRADSRTTEQHSPAVAEFDIDAKPAQPKAESRSGHTQRIKLDSVEATTTTIQTRTETQNTMGNLSNSVIAGPKQLHVVRQHQDPQPGIDDSGRHLINTCMGGKYEPESGFVNQEHTTETDADDDQEQIEEAERIERGISAWVDPHLKAAQSLGMENDTNWRDAFAALDSLQKYDALANWPTDSSAPKRYADRGQDFNQAFFVWGGENDAKAKAKLIAKMEPYVVEAHVSAFNAQRRTDGLPPINKQVMKNLVEQIKHRVNVLEAQQSNAPLREGMVITQ